MNRKLNPIISILIIVLCMCMVVIVWLLKSEDENNTVQINQLNTAMPPASTQQAISATTPEMTCTPSTQIDNTDSNWVDPHILGNTGDDMPNNNIHFTDKDEEYFDGLSIVISSMIPLKIQAYVNEYIQTDKEVGSDVGESGLATIVENTFLLDMDKWICTFDVNLNNGYIIHFKINILAEKFEMSDEKE